MSVLRNSLYSLYANDYAVLDMLDQISFKELEYKYQAEMDKRIDRESVTLAQLMLASDIIARYDRAVQESCMACTQDLAKIMELLITPATGKAN